MPQASDELKAIVVRITEYLSNGGLFNPELMDAKKVSRLLIDSRDAITAHLSTVEKPVAVREPGFDWTVSPETDQAMRDIDDSIRAAHMQASTTFVGSTHPADRDGVEARTLDEWHEDDGSVCWWALDENGQWLGEPAYIGSPLDLGRAYSLSIGEHEFVATLGGWPGYHTHWTPHPAFPTPPASALKGGE